jgi:crotonobetainyl-CoA:carnitine CoA-transferase CaiB-like acyl-CoA transferase
MAGARLPVRRGPPALGEHSLEVLRSLGYAKAEIDALQAAGIVANAVGRAADEIRTAPD